jgi:hypothetical protein
LGVSIESIFFVSAGEIAITGFLTSCDELFEDGITVAVLDG